MEFHINLDWQCGLLHHKICQTADFANDFHVQVAICGNWGRGKLTLYCKLEVDYGSESVKIIWIHFESVTWIEIEQIVPLYIEIRLRWHIYNADSSDNKFYCWIMLLWMRCFVNNVTCARNLLKLFYESIVIILFEWTASLKLIVVFKNELL